MDTAKYQARGTDLNIKRLARSVSKQNLTWQRSDAPLGFSRQSSRDATGSKENSRRPSDASKDGIVHPVTKSAFGDIPEE